ncbi:zinc finger and BTB domain-containing protein 32 isoform X2 [Ochotona princeps]|uniref:zinc finger and BTB domain-containing protein 32 isoform X2 n=1 Tax=Ochotona princeps TaxID=9978 RepID=UPI002714EDBB|nr:zinc finger and BTB domain-containing protein 32 isoform X2 [Ochotona princeps]
MRRSQSSPQGTLREEKRLRNLGLVQVLGENRRCHTSTSYQEIALRCQRQSVKVKVSGSPREQRRRAAANPFLAMGEHMGSKQQCCGTPSTGTWQKLWPLHQRIPLSLNAPKGLWSQNQLASSRPTPGSLPQGPAQLRPGETPQSQQGHPGVPTTCLDREGTTGHPLGQQPPLPPPARSRPYSCPVCGKRFSLKHQMETHHRVHTGEKPFSCGLCPQRSRDFSAMAKHLRTHGAAPYRCPLCGVGCSSLASMQAHMRSHSPSQLPPGWTIRSTFLYSSSSRPPRASTSPGSPSSACL